MSVFSSHAIVNIWKLHLHSVMKIVFLFTLGNSVSCRLFPCGLTLKGSTDKKTTENLYVLERFCSPLKQKLTISAFGLSQNQRETKLEYSKFPCLLYVPLHICAKWTKAVQYRKGDETGWGTTVLHKHMQPEDKKEELNTRLNASFM